MEAESLSATSDASGKRRSDSQTENKLAGVLRGWSLSDHVTAALRPTKTSDPVTWGRLPAPATLRLFLHL